MKSIAFLLSAALVGFLLALAIKLAVGGGGEMVRLPVCHAVKDETLTELYGPRQDGNAWIIPDLITTLTPAPEEGCTLIRLNTGQSFKVDGDRKDVYCLLFKSPLCLGREK